KSLDHRYESAVTMAAEVRSVGAILDVRSDASPPPVVHAAVRQPKGSGVGWIILLLVLAALAAVAWMQRATIESFIRRTLGLAPSPVIAMVRGAEQARPPQVSSRLRPWGQSLLCPRQQRSKPRAIDVAAADDGRDRAAAHVDAAPHQRRDAGCACAFRDHVLVLDEPGNRC